ncbi:hypothetical protein POF51_26520 [Brevibacillus sp. AG]|uniref:hypothetical protein n=1 Tax=Brevibacillus sp. AG TaxID=3020891 RepID=UPI00232ACADB|nr:hypothetical protein [Brevibacillus sp. AG]MDC0764279.1 hypothetical protein [Brevibacillus sp. AG]
MLSKNKLVKWLDKHDTNEAEPEVRRLIKNLLIEMDHGAFDYDDSEYDLDNPYEHA